MWRPDELSLNTPKYLAIALALATDIGKGRLLPGEKLPTHRELADVLSVNVSTITRAYNEAERRGLISGTVGRGTFVASDASVTRELMRADEPRSGYIEMGLVLPLYHHEPELMERLEKLNRSKNLASYLRYTDPAGIPEHREIAARWVRRFGMTAGLDNITVTAGAQHALACTLASCFQPGDRIGVDALTYPGIKTLAGMLHIRLVPIMMDEEGMVPDELETACRREPIRGIYLMPGMQNPTGTCMGDERRHKILAVIQRHALLLIEDDAYCYTAAAIKPALSSFLPGNSVFISGLSKILFAGLRVAFVVTAPQIRARLNAAVLNTLWMAPTFCAAIVTDCIDDGSIDRIIQDKLTESRSRNGIADTVLPRQVQRSSDCGFFLWHPLPEPWTGKTFEEEAKARGINVFCAEKFAVGNQEVPAAIRISLTGPETQAELAQGLTEIADLLKLDYLPMAGVF